MRVCVCVCVCAYLQTDKAKALLAFLENKFFDGNIQQTVDKEKVGCVHSHTSHLTHQVLSKIDGAIVPYIWPLCVCDSSHALTPAGWFG